MTSFIDARKEMIKSQLVARGLCDQTVLAAINAVPREKFVPTELVEFSYSDVPLPIAANQTISQPYIVALMTMALDLKSSDRVLEIGTGSGYAAAVLAEICSEVFSIERHKVLVDSARKRLAELGYNNIEVLHADGTLGWREYAPFDAIVVTAGGPKVPPELQQQLAIDGRLVMPVGKRLSCQKLVRVVKTSAKEYRQEELSEVSFVPLIGASGWHDEIAGLSLGLHLE